MKSYNRSSKNPVKLFFVSDLCFVYNQRFYKQIHQIKLCLHIVKGWRETLTNLILLLEETVGMILSTYHVIRQERKNISKYDMRNLGIPPTTKY